MGRGRKGAGVTAREKSIRIRFTWKGERCNEPLKLTPSPPNVKYAKRIYAEIKIKIEHGTFVYGDYFPDSSRAKIATGDDTIGAIGDLYLKGLGRLASSTKSQYANALEFWYEKLGGKDKRARDVRHGDLAAAVGGHEWPGAKLCNNYLIPLRGLFWLARKDKHIVDDPMEGIENSPLQETLPDPFTLEEALAIVNDIGTHYHEQVWNYFEYAFFGGERPEEEIAQQWGDIDWSMGTARVERVKTFKGEMRDVKGYRPRDVELAARAIAALDRQKAHTFMKGNEAAFIFENPVTGKPWHDERSQRDHYWKPSLKRLGIRYRRPYCTRHTFATIAIMGGANPTWVAKQMGNSPRVIYKFYAKWIDLADKSRERNKMDAAIGNLNLVPIRSTGTG